MAHCLVYRLDKHALTLFEPHLTHISFYNQTKTLNANISKRCYAPQARLGYAHSIILKLFFVMAKTMCRKNFCIFLIK